MQCPRCGFENPEGMKFCGQCASSLSRSCPQCGVANPPQFKFCGGCGASLLESAPPPAPLLGAQSPDARKEESGQRSARPADRAGREAERRQLTVMFCDLVASTALAERLDPEELREVVQRYQAACAAVISRFEGYIAQYLGDGLLVYFGYPVAHEDDAQRAVRAGLQIVEALHDLQARLPYPLQVRIGIHTGRVVVGEMGGGSRREQLALGDTPNIAARVQALAEADSVLTSAATYQLTRGFFHYLDLGPQKLKGITTLVQVYRPLRESDVQSRFEAATLTGLTPLVGRDSEVGFLLERWERVREGMGQVVLLSGEPGIGKSRVVQVLKARLPADTHTRLEFRCSSYSQNSTLYPVIELWQRLLQFQRDDSSQTKLEKLERTLGQYRFLQADTVPLFAALLSLPPPTGYPPLNLSAQRQKQKTQEAVVAWLFEEAERTAVCCTWEDLQWADPSTLELLNLCLDQVPTTRMLVLLTFRPEFSPPWAPHSYLTQLTLSRLAPQQVEEMIEKVGGGRALPAQVVRQLIARTDGVPLFVEELTKMVLESGLLREADGHYEFTGPLPPLAIPATLSDSLMARLDRLGTAKDTAQLGATLGREFPYELIRAVSPLDETTLQRELAQLVEAELLYQRGLPPQAQYIFKHALIQEVAYQSLLRGTRQQYHRQCAHVLQEQFPETLETQPELLAHHYTVAGFTEQAVSCWQQAGQRAIGRSANSEAISHLTKALGLLKTLSDTPERLQQELLLQVALGAALLATRGFAAPEVEYTYTRARELCQQVGETPQLFPVLRGLAAFYSVRAEYQITRELGEQCLRLAHHQQDSVLLLAAHFELGTALFCLGEFPQAREHWEQGMALYDPQKHRSHALLYGQDLGVSCLSRMTRVLWFLGYPDQALKRSQEALSLAQAQAHPFSLAYALNFATECHRLRGEVQAAQECAEAAIALSTTDQGFPIWATAATMLRGWLLVEQGQGEEGITQLRQGLTAWQTMGAEMARPYWLALLIDSYGKVGQAQEGLALLAGALAVVHHTGEREYEAELYRLKGELTLQKEASSWRLETSLSPQASSLKPPVSSGVAQEAEGYFLTAIDIARHQQAASLELRAVMSLSRLLQTQGKKNDARQMLAELYGWFTEGFDTADLKAAKTLLEEMSRN